MNTRPTLEDFKKVLETKGVPRFTNWDFMSSKWMNSETEVTVAWLWNFVIDRNKELESFPKKDLLKYYHKKLKKVESFHFNKLCFETDLNISDKEVISFTGEFIEHCYNLLTRRK
jgi:hypothetical protein